jgi:IS605 OrfB family transposase
MQTITVKFKLLEPNKGKLQKMASMAETYREACVWFAKEAERLNTVSRARLNRETYSIAKEKFNLNTATLQMAMMKALSARRSYLSRIRKGKKATPPTFKSHLPVMVRQDCYSVCQLPSGNFVLKFPVASGRSQIAVPLVVSEYHRQRLEQLAGGSCRQGCLELWCDRNNQWFAAVTLVYNDEQTDPCGVIGVDLGIVKHAVLSNNVFFDGRGNRWRKEHWAKRRKELQKHGRLSRVKKEQGRESRWMRDVNHKLSRRIVDIAIAENKAIALEQLTGIRERARGSKKFNRMLSGWSFKELAKFIEYKAALAGVPVIYVNPKETSKTCPRCGNISRNNRKTQGWFKCTSCGYQSDADRVGALNIATKAVNAGGV